MFALVEGHYYNLIPWQQLVPVVFLDYRYFLLNIYQYQHQEIDNKGEFVVIDGWFLIMVLDPKAECSELWTA